MIGATLQDRYRLDAELGQGGMGVVYRAHDTVLDRDVAVKCLSETGLGTEGRTRLLREAQAAAQLNHPNVVSVYDAGETDGTPFIVMELVEGESLHRRRPNTLDEILAIACQVCAALEHAHSHGIVHRDLKPENVMLARDGRAKLTDFGLARSVASRLTTDGTIVGTVFCLAPELALGQDFDGRADLYALGVMLYELTTGELPFVADDPLAVISQHLYAPVVAPRAKNPEIPAALDALIVELLSKTPEERPSSAAQVREALARLASGEEVPGIPIAGAAELSMLDRIVRGRLVARERELAQAKALWRKATTGEGQMLLVSGEPGIGKTRLVRELMTHARVSGAWAILGECYAEGGAPYAPFGQILRRALQDGNGAELELPDFVLADLLAVAPALQLRYPDVPPNPPLDPQSEQLRLFENMVAFCTVLSEHDPLLLVLEDAHWADSGTLAMLRHLARRTRRKRILIVATYREVELDETRPFREIMVDLNRERLVTRLKLSRLDQEGTCDLLAALFAEEITPEFLGGIYRETEGNPFFVEEVCKALVESGELHFADGHWHRPSMEELQIPQSVRVAIQSRVGKLPQDVQEVLRLAAILGREFDFDTLVEAGDLNEDTLIDALETAERAQLIQEVSGEGEVIFAFTHALIPTTLAEGVRTLRRRRLHRRAAAAIEQLRTEDYEALAYHYGAAGDEERALTYYARAGERASAAYANAEAERHFQAVLDLVDETADRAHWLAELGRVQARQSRYTEAIDTWQEAIDIYTALGDTDIVARLYAHAGRAAHDGGDPPRGLTLCREGMAAVAGAPDSPGMASLVHATALANLFNGLPNQADALCRRALEMAERLDVADVRADALNTLGLLPGQPPDEALSTLTQAVELAEAGGMLRQASRAHNNLAVLLYVNVGDLEAAGEHLVRAAELSRQRGDVAHELFYTANATVMAAWLGDFARVEEELPSLRQLLDGIHDPGPAAYLFRLAEMLPWRCRGALAEAIEHMQVVLEEARQAGDLQVCVGVGPFLGDALAEAGQQEAAEAILQETIALADGGAPGDSVLPRGFLSMVRLQQGAIVDAQSLLSEARKKAAQLGSRALDTVGMSWAKAHLAAAQGHWFEAMAAFEATAGGFARMGMRWFRARTLREWAEAHLARGEPGDRERARDLLQEARAQFQEMDVPFYAAQIEEQLKALGVE